MSTNGGILWHNCCPNVRRILPEKYVGLEERVEDGVWSVYVGRLLPGPLDVRDHRLSGPHHRHRLPRCVLLMTSVCT